MNVLTLLALLTFTLADPSGDAIGGGTLEPPTSPIYANAAQFDLLGVELHTPELLTPTPPTAEVAGRAADGFDANSDDAARPAAGTASRLTISLGSLTSRSSSPSAGGVERERADSAVATTGGTTGDAQALPGDAAANDPDDDGPVVEENFDLSTLLTVIDVYIGVGDGESDVRLDRTLDGPNMLMPLGQGWRYAVRVSADGALAITYVGPRDATDDESRDPGREESAAVSDGRPVAELGAAEGTAATSEIESSPAAQLLIEPLSVTRRGNDLIMELPWRLEGDVDLYALSGVHDPFSTSGWRQLSSQPSPWAFSGDGQVSPVIDLIAPDAAAQSAALASGVLPRPPKPEVGFTLPRTPWPYLMLGGLLLAVVGLMLRGRVPTPKGAAVADADDAPPTTGDEAELTAQVAVDGDVAATDEAAADETATEIPVTETPAIDTSADETATEIPVTETPAIDTSATEAPIPGGEAPYEPPSDGRAPADRSPGPIAAAPSHQASDDVTLVIGDDEAETPKVLSNDEELPPTSPLKVVDSAATPERSAVRERHLVDSEVERSYLGSNATGFDDDGNADDDDLTESFWHPRSRKPTLTGLKVHSDGPPGSD